MAKTTEEQEKELEDARELFAFGKWHAAYGGDELSRLAVKIAIQLAGDDYIMIAEACGWTREELNDFRLSWFRLHRKTGPGVFTGAG